jgi:hypothetical protein
MTDGIGTVDALRLQGAHRLDPVGFHYIEVLAERASVHQGRVKHILDGKLEAAVVALRMRLDQTNRTSKDAATTTPAVHGETLGDLVRLLAEHSLEKPDGRLALSITTPRTELKSVKYFRNTWSKLSAERQVTQALGQAPKNAGPINSHVVALRSLALIRDTSPDYLNRFMSYVDTLLSLEQGERQPVPAVKAPRLKKSKTKS